MKVNDYSNVPIFMWTDGVPVEEEATKQLQNVASLPFVQPHVAVMPDVHWGKGATIGSVIPCYGAVIPAAAGVDLGCFPGETKVPLLDGTEQTLLELSMRVEPFWVYSLDKYLQIAPGKAICVKTRNNAKLMKITISGGNTIYCTSDHQFMKRDGSYCAAINLHLNDSLMPLYRRWEGKDGYEYILEQKKQRLTHKLVWERTTGTVIPNNHVVHHINNKNYDNRPENLQLMTTKEHAKHHRLIGHTFNNYDENFQKARMAGIARRVADPIALQKMKEVGIENIRNYMRNNEEHFKKSIADNGKRGAEYLRKFNTSPRTCDICGKISNNPASLFWHKKREHICNHKVIAIEFTDKVSDVYCLQVEEHHNFALSAGVFVHNCGVLAVETSLTSDQLPDNLAALRSAIEQAVPHGRSHNGDPSRDIGAYNNPPEYIMDSWTLESYPKGSLKQRFELITEKYPKLLKGSTVQHLGTLGTGNHFIELCLDERNFIWIMLHTGSRGVGNRIGNYFIEQAKKEAEKWFINLPDKDLAYLPENSELFDDYVTAVGWAQDYASKNRSLIFGSIWNVLVDQLPSSSFTLGEKVINCHHNYVSKEYHYGKYLWITRKGAVSAKEGELGIIPGCFAAGTRILMASGLYKNIEDIKIGDVIIAGDGAPTTVTNTFYRGERIVYKYRNNAFHQETVATPDHLHFIGDLSTANIQTEGRLKVIDRPYRCGKSKYQWRQLKDLMPSKQTMLMPKCVNFSNMPNTFDFVSNGFRFTPSYELGYVFGTFIGDGTCYYKSSTGGQISWAFGLHERTVVDKLISCLTTLGINAKIYYNDKCLLPMVHNAGLAREFTTFGKKDTKCLPDILWCQDIEYIKGIYDGLIDSNGHIHAKTQKLTNTSSLCIEQFGVIHYILFGYWPSISVRAPSSGGLLRCNLDNCKPSYRATSLRLPPLAKNHQLIELLFIKKENKYEHVFDIEVDNKDHSFIANNVIVHNSMGAKSFIVRGKGNPKSFCSCSHGAGRAMSRGEAKRRFTVADHAAATAHVECRKDLAVVDETPMAYKDIDAVMAAQSDLVDVVHTLRQVLCVKG